MRLLRSRVVADVDVGLQHVARSLSVLLYFGFVYGLVVMLTAGLCRPCYEVPSSPGVQEGV